VFDLITGHAPSVALERAEETNSPPRSEGTEFIAEFERGGSRERPVSKRDETELSRCILAAFGTGKTNGKL
jgi:hypothetical protein